MTKYIRQTSKTTCGPVAVFNALKWAGYNFTRKSHFKKLCKELQWSSTVKMGCIGTHPHYVHNIWNKYPKIKMIGSSTTLDFDIKNLDGFLDCGNTAFVMRYFRIINNKSFGHYVFCPSRTPKRYILINNKKNKTIMYQTRDTMLKMLKQIHCDEFASHQPYMWLLQRNIK